ncbi:hypothetical protein ABE402_01470 [Bacillus smithii]|uniref:hypothetical protein n=1 Tax=Bacillus smithii TaxID=1479 RepID=UPI003D20F18A
MTTAVGITLLVVGIALLPFGVIYFKDSWKEIKELSPIAKKTAIFLEILDLFTAPIGSTSLLFLSLIFIIGGIGLVFLEFL